MRSQGPAGNALRGYPWVTVCAPELGARLGGATALAASGAFAEVAELSGGQVFLRATPFIEDYQGDAVRRVFETLAPLPLTGRSRRPSRGGRLVEDADAADYRHGRPGRSVREGSYIGAVTTRMIVLNGGSSSGKSGIVRCLQAVLPDPWLAFGCDSFTEALPARMQESDGGILVAPDGQVSVGAEFRALEVAWIEGVVTMARAGARVIIDEVFLGGAASQQRWQKAAAGLDVLWVGVRCDSAVATGRETARGDRTPGMAASQADVVHQGVFYDLEVDTTHTEALACARAIAARVG